MRLFAKPPLVECRPGRRRSSRFAGRGIWLLLAAGCLLSGCANPSLVFRAPPYHPQNVFAFSPNLPADLKRVAVMPLSVAPEQTDLIEGAGMLEAMVAAELVKTARFEVVCPAAESIRSHTGRSAWDMEGELPADLLSFMREVWGCDAVLFCRLTAFHGYAPLTVGWRLRLVNARTGTTVWAAEDRFDAGQPSVQTAARAYQLEALRDTAPSQDEWAMGNSPRLFGQYTLATLFATLPGR